MAEKRIIDWEAIGKQYRAGILSIREIAKQHGLNDKAVRNKAKEYGWERDLTEKIKEKVRIGLVRTSPQNEKETVEEAANTQIAIIKGNRKQIGKAQALVDLLTQQLTDVAGNRSAFEDAAAVLAGEEDSNIRTAMVNKAISLSTHSTIAVNLTVALKNLIGLERQAFGINNTQGADEDTEVKGVKITLVRSNAD